MTTIPGDIKDLLKIRLKPRYDSFWDQYSRVFMVKLLLVCTLLIAFNEHRESISCIVPEGDVFVKYILGNVYILCQQDFFRLLTPPPLLSICQPLGIPVSPLPLLSVYVSHWVSLSGMLTLLSIRPFLN